MGQGNFSIAASASTLAHEPYDEQISCVTYGYDRLRFTAPVLVNDTVTCYYTVEEVDYEKGRSYADIVIKNQHDKVVLVAKHPMQWIPLEG